MQSWGSSRVVSRIFDDYNILHVFLTKLNTNENMNSGSFWVKGNFLMSDPIEN